MENTTCNVEIEGEIGRICVENGSALVSKHQPKERIYTLSQQEMSMIVGSDLSYHKGLKLLNRLLHRSPETAIKFRTYRDFCERSGKQIENYVAHNSHDILKAHHFDAETGKPIGSLATELTQDAQPYVNEKAVKSAIKRINSTRISPDEQIKSEHRQLEDPQETIYISIDNIGVKHQKEHRSKDEEKKSVYVQNTVADIETNNGSYKVTGVGMKNVFLYVLSYLLQNNLLVEKKLVFLTDGARDIFANIEELFAFHPYTVILDWYHLKKRCQEYLSMSVKGKEQRNAILQKLLRILWVGNADEALVYLQNLEEDKLRPNNRIEDLCKYIQKHREHIPPYALRAELGLKNSSNRVEKANDLVVAQRQKHNGMSWSTSGSGALAQISALIINNELSSWLNQGILPAFHYSAA